VRNKYSTRSIAVVSLFAMLLVLPGTANASVADIILLLKTITTTLRGDVGMVLGGIRSVSASAANFEQQVVWPLNLISQTKSFVAGMRSQYAGLAQRVYSIPIHSATLPNSLKLESVLRAGQVSNLGQLANSYGRVYQPLPLPADARSSDRNLMDGDDAIAIGALKTAVVADQGSQSTLGVADVLERQATVTAPGVAPLLTAQAQAADLQSEAILHHLLAAELREEAAKVAHYNALRKRRAESSKNLRNQLQQILAR
jgi:hypothetical protein